MKGTISQKQQKVYEFINMFIEEHGYAPSVREIARGCNIKSPSTIHYYLKKLKQYNLIKDDQSKSRTLKIISHQEMNPLKHLVGDSMYDVVQIDTFEDGNVQNSTFPISSYYIDTENTICAKVIDDGFKDEGIFEGDYVFIKKQLTAKPGELIAAIYEDRIIIRRLIKKIDHIKLKPANERFPALILRDHIKIIGKVIAVFKHWRK